MIGGRRAADSNDARSSTQILVPDAVERSSPSRREVGTRLGTGSLPLLGDMIFERLPRRQTAILLVVCVAVLALVGKRLAAAGTARAPAPQAVSLGRGHDRRRGGRRAEARRLRRRCRSARGSRAPVRGRAGGGCARAGRRPEPPRRPHARQPRRAGRRRAADRRSRRALPAGAGGGGGAARQRRARR